MTKQFKVSELRDRTYGSFHRNGISVDLSGFFRSSDGKRVLATLTRPGKDSNTTNEEKSKKKD